MNEKIEEIKKIKGINSKKIVGTLSKVSIIGIKKETSRLSKNFISSKIFKKKLRHKNTKLIIKRLFKKTLIR